MGKINILSFEIANLIAAGEVVERPSSVLKELIENSIDAGATEIVAEIKKGGVALIRVSDNGCGIDKEDLPVALKRHATSKIKERDDLYSIMTLGFRGEALAAISSVSQVTIITKTRDAEIGYMLTSEGGKIIDMSEVGASEGTTVVVENLFFNVPARRKFLKKDATEAMSVSALVERVALSHPEISIQLLIDGEERFKTPGSGDLRATIRSVFGKEFASKLIEVSGEAEGVRVSGFIGRSDNVRKNRNLENVFINKRYVKSLTVQAAIEKAFTSYIAPECFPTCALFLEMNPSFVDVNVHPAKLEVKFSDERRVFEAVYYTIKSALENEEYRPELVLGSRKNDRNAIGAFVPVGDNTNPDQISFGMNRPEANKVSAGGSDFKFRPETGTEGVIMSRSGGQYYTDSYSSYNRDNRTAAASYKGSNGETTLTPKASLDILKKYEASVSAAENSHASHSENTANELPSYKFVGEAFDTYIIIEYMGELLIIDKHAAHERVIFEDLKRRMNEDKRCGSQALILPITVILTADEISSVSEFREDFISLGFEFNISEKSCDITAIPDAISATDAEGLFVKMAGEISGGEGKPEITEAIRRERALYQVACKAAIKGGRIYDKAVIEWLIAKVLELPDITVCPHGRPIAYKLKKSELDRQFERLK